MTNLPLRVRKRVTLAPLDYPPRMKFWNDLDFEHGTQLFHGSITFEPTSGGLQVSWAIETDMGANPFKRWAGLFLGKLMGGDMATGLINLKQQTETAK